MNLTEIFNLEPLILNAINWNIHTCTVFELSSTILLEIFKENESENLENVKNCLKDYILFAVSGNIFLMFKILIFLLNIINILLLCQQLELL